MRVVLLTGTSSGIGRRAVHALAQKGCHVVATARSLEDIETLAAENVDVAELDVTHEASMAQVVRDTLAAHGRIDALVNNAGYGMFLPVEETPLEALRAMYEVNLFGLHRLTQLVLPSMRRQGAGRIVNVSSIAGHVGFPMIGHYCGSKFAVRGMSQALRAEVRPFGIHVSLIEPGSIGTGFGQRAEQERDRAKGIDTAYAGMYDRFDRLHSFKGRGHPDVIARRIVHACTSRRPRFHYLAPWDAKGASVLNRMLPDAAINAALARAFRFRPK